jgi:hypothetical protein
LEGGYDFKSELIYTFVTSCVSSLGRLAVGCKDGKVLMYEIPSRAKIGINEDIHDHEIVKILFYEDHNQMITFDL